MYLRIHITIPRKEVKINMWNFYKTRQTAGNICLVLFTAFLFTILVSPFTMVGSAEAAQQTKNGTTITTVSPSGNTYVEGGQTATITGTASGYELMVNIAVNPLTEFNTLRIDFVNGNGTILSVYGNDTTKVTYKAYSSVYGTVYSLAYLAPSSFYLSSNSVVYGKVYVGSTFYENILFNLTLQPPNRDGNGPGGTSVPSTGGVEKPASELVGSGAKEVSIKAGNVTFVVPAGALDIQQLTDLLKADPNAKVTFTAKEVTPASVNLSDKMGKPETANLKAIGKVFDFTIIVKSKDGETNITNFGKKLKVAIPYSDSDLEGLSEMALGAYRITAGGLVFLGGEVDKDKNLVWFETESFSNYTLMAKVAAFADIMSHWAKDDIQLMADKGIVKGMSENLFAPDANITRSQFATLLVKALGLSEVSPAVGTFKDVNSKAWYYSMVETAAANGIVAGFDGKFNPEGKITRQEMAVMIAKALKAGGKTNTVTSAEVDQLLNKFSDKQQVSAWAKESVAVAVKEGIINGRTENTFVAKANATRAEGTVMLKKNLTSLGKL